MFLPTVILSILLSWEKQLAGLSNFDGRLMKRIIHLDKKLPGTVWNAKLFYDMQKKYSQLIYPSHLSISA